MSLTTICGLTLLRTLVLSLLAIPICLAIEGLMRRLSERTRWLIQFFLFVPFCFPELLVGYAYRDIALAHPKWAEPLCALLLWCRMLPVGVIALLLAPRSLCNVESIHCRRLKKGTGPFSGPENGPVPFLNLELVNCYWYGPIRRVLPALGLMALIGLQEFELAALLMTESWTNWFIDAQRLGLQRSEMLIQGLKPFVLQIPLIVALLYWLASSRTGDSDTHWTHDQEAAIPNRSALQTVLALIGLILSNVVAVIGPLWLMGWRTFQGFDGLLRQQTQLIGLMKEVLTASAVSICAAMIAFSIVQWVFRFAKKPNGIVYVILLPGLMGSLLVAIATVEIFQQPVLRSLYDTPVPWVVALVVWIVPRAFILQMWMANPVFSESIAAAQMLDGRNPSVRHLVWRLRVWPKMFAVGVLCYWAYAELPTAYLLAPSRMASGLVRLYNFMHFGRSASLSAESLIFFITPVLMGWMIVMMLSLVLMKSSVFTGRSLNNRGGTRE